MSLNFEFTEEQNALAHKVRQLAQKEIQPHLQDWDEKEELPWHALKALAGEGFLGVIGPERLGGLEADYISLGIVIENLARTDTSCAMICSMQNTLSTLTPGWDEDDIREVYKGNKLLCIATSEEEAGSDVSNLSTIAEADGDSYVINGEKIHVSLMPGASIMGVSAKIMDGSNKPRIEFLKVPADAEGVSCELMPEMGMRSHQLGRVRLKNVRAPLDSVLGKGKGLKDGKALMYARWDVSRCLSALNAVGTALSVLDATIEFVKQKEVYGQKIGRYQAVQFPLIEHYTKIEACKLLAYKGLWRNHTGQSASKEATMAKWYGVTSAIDAVKDCLQMYGASGYLKELDIERRLRDVIGLSFTGGTINVMKLIVVRELLGKEFMGLGGSR